MVYRHLKRGRRSKVAVTVALEHEWSGSNLSDGSYIDDASDGDDGNSSDGGSETNMEVCPPGK